MNWINKDTEIYCSFAKEAGNTGCRMMNTAFYFYGLNKIYKSFSVDSIEKAVRFCSDFGYKRFCYNNALQRTSVGVCRRDG